MTFRLHPLALIFPVGALAAPLLLARPAVSPTAAPTTASAPALQDKHEEFLKKYKEVMVINARDEMAKLMKSYPDEAVARIVFTCEQIATQNSDELEELIEGLRKGWAAAYDTGFVDSQYRYFSFLDSSFKRERNSLKKRYDAAIGRFTKATAAKDQVELELLGGQMEGLAKSFETVGDRYYAGQSWYIYANCYDETLRENKSDLEKAAKGYGAALEHRKAIELVGKTTDQLKVRYDRLVAEGWVEPEEGATTEASASGAAAGAAKPAPAAPLTVGMSFELIEDLDQFARPNYYADGLYPMWPGLQFRGNGSTAKFNSMKEGPLLHRVGSADIRVDKNRNGTPDDDDKVPLTGNFTAVEVTLGSGAEERPWAFLCVTGAEQDTFHNIQMNLLPQDQFVSLYTVAAGSMTGMIGETPVRVIDENMDGVYGGPPLMWAHQGLTSDMTQPEIDSMVIGNAKRAVPWSEYVKVEDQWYKLESVKGGKELVATPATVRTGKLKLSFKGGKPTWLVVRGSNNYENCYFDLVGEKTLEVPVGRYSLFYGEIRKGKKRQASKSLILPGNRTPNWVVAEGETVTVELGSPFNYDFRFKRDGDELTVDGKSVVVIGKSLERYERAWNAVPRPDVSWRKAGSKRGSKGETMDVIMDQQTANDLGLDKTWKPLDLTLRINASADDKIEVQLKEKKNPLFGKVESEWRGSK